MLKKWKPRHLACKITIEFNKDRNIGHHVSPLAKTSPRNPQITLQSSQNTIQDDKALNLGLEVKEQN
jgi:hypothetical protein